MGGMLAPVARSLKAGGRRGKRDRDKRYGCERNGP